MNHLRSGFTLIELMIVVMVIGILATLAIPNYLAMQDRAREADVKSLAHTVQLVAENYASSHNGVYSDTAADLTPLMPGGHLQDNAFTDQPTEPQFGVGATTSGQVGIVAFSENGVNVGYTISGCGRNGEIIVQIGVQ